MIRVLHVIGSMNIGGAETILMNLYRNVDRTKVQFDFAVHTNEECHFDLEIEKLGGHIYHFSRFNGLNGNTYKKQWATFFQKHCEHQIVHCHIGSCAALCLKVAKKYNKITIAHSHNIRKANDFSLHNLLWSCFSFPTRFIADFFVACSYQAGLDRFGSKVAKSNRFKVLNNGIDSSTFKFNAFDRNRIRKELNIDDKIVIGHVGRFVAQKNHSFLIDVFNIFHSSNPNTCLVVVGDGELLPSIKNKVKELGLEEDVLFLGSRTDIPSLLSSFDLFVFPSKNEGLGISVIEAQASGLHVVCSDCLPPESKISDVITYLSLKKTKEEWASCLHVDDYLFDRHNAYLNVSKHNYDIHQSSENLVNLYEKLLFE